MSSTSFKYSNKVTEPDLDIANVYEICYAPRSTRRTKGPIYAIDFYTNKIVMFEGPTQQANEVKTDDNNNDIDIDIDININMKQEKEDVLEFNTDYREEITSKVKLILEKSDPVNYKQMMGDPRFATSFHNDQYLPAIENYVRFLKDPEGSGIEDLAKGQFESHLQEDGTIVSFPVEQHPVIFPFHIKNREIERRIKTQEAHEHFIRAQEARNRYFYEQRVQQLFQAQEREKKKAEEERILRSLQEIQNYSWFQRNR